jgi:hypothetical protein
VESQPTWRAELLLTLNPDQKADALERKEVHAGDLCPACQAGRIDYDSLLNLACPRCGYIQAGCFT